MNVPINTRITAWFIKNFLSLFEFRSLAVYVADETPYNFVIIHGDPKYTIVGISNMVTILANETGKPEQEILRLIAKSRPEKM